jgi:hypothetical protein
MHLDPVDALTEAQQEEEAEQGMIRSDLTPVEINEIAEAVHQHNQRLIQQSDGVWRKGGVSVSGSRVEFDSLMDL